MVASQDTLIDTDAEAYRTLLARAHRRTGHVPAELLVRHVLAVTRGGDWPVRRDALEALLRRVASARADQVRIVGRPADGRAVGLYATQRPDAGGVGLNLQRAASACINIELPWNPAVLEQRIGPEPEDDPAERELESLLSAADESRDASAVAPAPPPSPSTADVQRLFSGLSVQRTAAGGLVIEAPPETASTLAALFAGMAQLLQTTAAAASGPRPSSS